MQKALIALIALGLNLVACNKSQTAPSENAEVAKVEAKQDAATATKATAASATAPAKKIEVPPMPNQIAPPADVAAAPADAQKTESGLAWKIITKGTGTKNPAAADIVEVHYTGWTTDGKMFDSSVTRGRPAKFPLNRVIKGWTEGVQKLVQGDKALFWIPGALAYGDTPTRPGAPAGMLVFEIELLGIEEAPKPIPAPADVAAAPADAKKTASGLAYKVLKAGSGAAKPAATSMVDVHYTGWTTDGKMFDSSVLRGKSAQFPLNAVIKGWTEGVQLMVEGEKTRFWIPSELAYGNRPGRPQGTLVFDVELLKIIK